MQLIKQIPNSDKPPDYFMLNKPPPIPFNLPKGASLTSRPTIDDSDEYPEIALKKLETEARTLKEEVGALKWLAKRKEQEWNSIIGLLKKKEETWLKVKRQAELAMTDNGQGFQKLKVPGTTATVQPVPVVRHPTPTVNVRPANSYTHATISAAPSSQGKMPSAY
jgi:hypothetical protein